MQQITCAGQMPMLFISHSTVNDVFETLLSNRISDSISNIEAWFDLYV